jgi:hypothetical protein
LSPVRDAWIELDKVPSFRVWGLLAASNIRSSVWAESKNFEMDSFTSDDLLTLTPFSRVLEFRYDFFFRPSGDAMALRMETELSMLLLICDAIYLSMNMLVGCCERRGGGTV